MTTESSSLQAQVNAFLRYEESVQYGPTHALWKALDDGAPLEVLIGIIDTPAVEGVNNMGGGGGFGGPLGVSKGTLYTPLHCAAQRGHMELAKYLIAHGTDVKAKTYNDMTAIDFAEHSFKYPELVALLKEAAKSQQ